jgi:hypothetical protein
MPGTCTDSGTASPDVAAVDLAYLCDDAVLDAIRVAEEQARQALAGQLMFIAEAHRRGLAGRQFCGSTAVLLAQMLRVSRVEAKQRVRLAQRVLPQPTLTGEQVPAAIR